MELNSKFILFVVPLLSTLSLFTACQWTDDINRNIEEAYTQKIPKKQRDGSYYKMLRKLGFVNIAEFDSTIIVDLRYASKNNFTNRDLYGDYDSCFMHHETAQKLSIAQSLLKNIDEQMSLVVFDGARPLSVQGKMWESIDVEDNTKRKFLANPQAVSMHNMGLAVDVSIILTGNTLLDMGTEFDHIGELAYPCLEDYFLEKEMLGYNQVNNRQLLREVMEEAGFNSNKYEWWHFSFYTRDFALSNYPVVSDFTSYSAPIQTIMPSPVLTDGEVFFSVQIAASSRRLSRNDLCAENFKFYTHQGMFKYRVGDFSDLESAYFAKDSLLKSGCKSCFIIAFYQGQRINISDALKLKEE